MISAKEDGITHINVYSKGQTELGRLLTNLAHTPFTGGNHTFASVEGWWYWFKTGKKFPHLKSLYGFEAKRQGREFPVVKIITPDDLLRVYQRKVDCNPHIAELLRKNTLPFFHYYVYGDKIVQAKHLWTATLWSRVRV